MLLFRQVFHHHDSKADEFFDEQMEFIREGKQEHYRVSCVVIMLLDDQRSCASSSYLN